ncbi:MAG: FeoA family protein [Tissierellia bacterium]|nr:FeoA family protein [Tissierellia bacterium]
MEYIPLSAISEGETCRIIRIQSQGPSTKRLYEMGLHTGAEVKVKKNDHKGPQILGIHGANIAIGRNLADGIQVRKGEKA